MDGTRPRIGAGYAGYKVGKLTVEAPTEKRVSRYTVWRCRCDCGNTCFVSTHQLYGGNTKSCGCLGHPPLKRLVGERFGRLTVVRYAGKKDGQHYWKCRCDCGGTSVVGQTALLSGETTHCGCMTRQHIDEALKREGGTSILMLEIGLSRLRSSNTSGHTGVHRTPNGRWVAKIGYKGRNFYLGSFEDKADAIEARRKAAAHGGEPPEDVSRRIGAPDPQRAKEDAG